MLFERVFPRPVASVRSLRNHAATRESHKVEGGAADAEGELEMLALGLAEGDALSDELGDGEELGEAETELLGLADSDADGLETCVLRISTKPTALGLADESVNEAEALLPVVW